MVQSLGSFALLTQSLRDYAIITLDATGIITAWSCGAEHLLGYTAQEALGTRFVDFIHPESPATRTRSLELEEALQKGRISYERWQHRRDGSHFLAHHITEAVRSTEGKVVGFSRIIHDVTSARLEEESLRSIMDYSMDAIFTIDEAGIIQTCAGAVHSVCGYNICELIGNNINILMPEPMHGEHGGYLANYLRTGNAKNLGRVREVTGLCKNGSQVSLELAITEFLLEGRRFFTGILRDISRRKLVEESLQSSQHMLRTILNHIPQGVFWKDVNSRYLGCNTVVSRAFGWMHPEQMIGKTDYDMPSVTREQAEFFIQKDQEVICSGQPCYGIIERVTLADGSTIWLETNKMPLLDVRDNIVGLLGTWEDITSRKHLEEQLRQSQKMEAVGQLAGGVAHDFNNSLTVMNGYTELVLNSLSADNPHKALLAEVFAAGNRAAALTMQLLAFSRKQILAPKVLNLNYVVERSERMLRRMIGEDVMLMVACDPLAHHVEVDPCQIEQVIMNLIVNARDAMPSGGTVTISSANMEVDEDECLLYGVKAGCYVALTVADSGCGMTPEVKSRIFEPFYTTKETGKGTGLGLATVYGIVKQSGGFITVDSVVGAGTTFTICLPARAEQVDSSESAGGELHSGGKETVLLVEDENAVRNLARLILQTQGYTVLAASGGPEAIKLLLLHTGPIHLLISDIVMPEMSGRQLADILITRYPGLKLLFVSGYIDDAIVRHGISHLDNAFLQKPFSQESLLRKVRDVLDAEN